MDAVNFVLGAIGTLASFIGLFYAALAARRSEALLRRLVVYPFRELDVAFARLNVDERNVVRALYRQTNGGSSPITQAIVAAVLAEYPQAGAPMLEFLEHEGWILRRAIDGPIGMNADRLPYITFLNEVEGEGRMNGQG